MFPRKILVAAWISAALAFAQQPPVKVNVLNVCTPSPDEQKELSAALAKVPGKPTFGTDYEVARGRSTLDQSAAIPGMQPLPAGVTSTADWVRVRREFPESAPFSNTQYSFSLDSKDMVETLVFRVREPKDLMQISIEDSASAVTSPAAMLSTNTPVSRIKLERFGRSSVVLARCSTSEGGPLPDQSAYEPIFRTAFSIMSRYRDGLGVRRLVPQELDRLGAGGVAKTGAGVKKNR
ncbi:MAG: hypothetical protein WAQ52_06620 [Terriglobales bacterium]